jgi:Uncharacterized conserved protein (DUF2163)/Phage conserved hypothetical protein BR0599
VTLPSALSELIFSGNFSDFDLYTITTAAGEVIRFTSADFPIKATINLAGVQTTGLYPTAPFVDQKDSKVQAHWKLGLDTDTWVVVVMPRPFDLVTGDAFPDQIGGLPWAQACVGGALDAADFQVDRAYFATTPTWPMPPGGAVPVGTWTVFAGAVAEVDPLDNAVVITANDYRSLLTTSMPLHFYASGCRYVLFDIGCTLSAATFQQSGAAQAGSTQQSIVTTGLTPPAGSSGTFVLGKITFTSGLNNGLSQMITNFVSGVASMFQPFPFEVETGDTFNIWPGCNKTQASCTAFNNLINYGGAGDFAPPPEIMG